MSADLGLRVQNYVVCAFLPEPFYGTLRTRTLFYGTRYGEGSPVAFVLSRDFMCLFHERGIEQL